MLVRTLLLLSISYFVLSTSIIYKVEPDESSCVCHHGYNVQKHPKDKRFYCKGILHEGKSACVNLERPRCKCTLIKGFIVQDLYGYWCIKVKPGYVEEIRWDCENKNNWDEFFKLYPEERPSADTEV